MEEIVQIPSNDAKVGMTVVISDHPCKIVKVSSSNSTVHLEGTDIFTREKYTKDFPSNGTISVPDVVRTEYAVVDISEDFVILMNESGVVREDLEFTGDEALRKRLMSDHANGQAIKVIVVYSMGKEMMFFPGYQKM